jgi:hypothetical protein
MKSCRERVKGQWLGTKEDLEKLLEDWENGTEKYVEEIGTIEDYALSYDYVQPGTFKDQLVGYWRYLMSAGGPQDKIRFYDTGTVQYWFLDWFDGACKTITSEHIVERLGNYFAHTEYIK